MQISIIVSWSHSTKYYLKNIHRSNLKTHYLDREFFWHSYHFALIIYYDPLLSNLINKTSILDFFIITRLSLLLLIRLNDNPLVSKKYIGFTTCFYFILITSEGKRRGAFLYWSHTPCTYSFSRVSFAYIRKTNRKWGNQFYLTHACM